MTRAIVEADSGFAEWADRIAGDSDTLVEVLTDPGFRRVLRAAYRAGYVQGGLDIIRPIKEATR